MKKRTVRPLNVMSLVVCLLSVAMVLLALNLPLLTFTSTVYTKKSSNTFKGDEKYQAAMAEVQAAAAEFEKMGEVEIGESFTERTNSKGETTSLATFTIRQTEKRSGYAMIASGLPSGRTLAAVLVFAMLGAVLAAAGFAAAPNALHRDLRGAPKLLRSVGGFAALAGLVLVPIFCCQVTLDFVRKITLFAGGNEVKGIDALLSGIDKLLYKGAAGEKIADMVSGLSVSISPLLVLIAAALFVEICAIVMLRKGGLAETMQRGALYAFVIALSVCILYPFFVMFITGFRTNAETLDMYFLNILPTKWVWSNLVDIVNRGVLRYMLNSVLIATGATAIAMLCGIPAAYGLARMNFKGKAVFMGFVIMSQMFSPVVLLVGISTLMNTLHLNDSIVGLMLINAAFNQAFAIWLLRGTFISISPEMEQAACIDGCNTVGALLNILLPMAAPGIVTTLIFVFINAWNEYTISTILISTNVNKPITVGITQFSSFNMIEWQYLFAAALLATIPVVILFMCIEKHLAAGLTSGGVKG